MAKDESLTLKEAFLKTASYCAYQERCESEVRTKLMKLGIRGTDIQEVMELLMEENFLNEQRFAIAFASGKFRVKKWGKMKIAQGLMQKGVNDECIHQGLLVIDDEEYYDTLYRLLQKKWDTLSDIDNFKKKGKVVNYGISKGFEPNVIWDIMRELEYEG